MKQARVWPVIAVIAAMTGLPPAAAKAPRILSGAVTVTATRSYTTLVTVAHAAKVDIQSIHLIGQGREFGFALRKVGRGTNQPVFFGLTSGHCTSVGCSSSGYFGVDGLVGGTGSEPILAAGVYRLYVVADGRPVTVQFRLSPSGRSTVTSGTAWAPTIAQPAPTDSGPQLTMYASGLAVNVGPNGGLQHLVSWKRLTVPRSANTVGLCLVHGTATWAVKPYQVPCTTEDINVGSVSGQSQDDRDSSGATYLSDFESGGLLSAGRSEIGAFNDGETPAAEAHTQVTFWSFPAN
jgi:hypothetical protein